MLRPLSPLASTSAPRSRRMRMMSALPLLAATRSGELRGARICQPHGLDEAVAEGADFEAGVADAHGLEVSEEEQGT
eukprot:766298-Hanusia_phi.AAC.7